MTNEKSFINSETRPDLNYPDEQGQLTAPGLNTTELCCATAALVTRRTSRYSNMKIKRIAQKAPGSASQR